MPAFTLRALGVVAAVLLALPPLPAETNAEAQDWDIPGGHYYTQTGGYAVLDRDGIPFWSEFQRLGGPHAIGYPVTQRFSWNGFAIQAVQRVVLQWRPDAAQAAFVNVFDLLSQAGKDEWLNRNRQVPYPLSPSFDAGKTWDEVVRTRLSLLDANPAIKQAYFGTAGDPLQMNGLPASSVTDMGNHYSLRAQRVVIQQWKEDVPWARAGAVTVALGGTIAKEAGLLPAEAMAPPGPPPGPGFVALGLPLRWPVTGPIYTYFGGYHRGIDISPPYGTPVAAADGGAVAWVRYDNFDYGYHLLIDHGNGYQTMYAHLSEILVQPGRAVSRGDVVGRVGITGRATGPHLHFELWQGSIPVNPLAALP